MEEIWKDIKGYEGIYQVSNFGRVRSLDRTVADKRGRTLKIKGKILSPSVSPKGGYLGIALCKNGKSHSMKVHRLVAEAFIPNDNNLPCINHKDEDTSNNKASNLEWCTWKYNDNYGKHSERISKSHSKRVAQYTLEGELVAVYDNAFYASRAVGVGDSQIRSCAAGKTRKGKHGLQTFKTAGGYKWKYLN